MSRDVPEVEVHEGVNQARVDPRAGVLRRLRVNPLREENQEKERKGVRS